MDPSSSSQDSVPKKDCNVSIFSHNQNLNVKTFGTDAISEKDSVSKNLAITDNSEIKKIKTSTVAHNQASHATIDKKKTKAVDSKSKVMNRSGLNFLPGSKLEAKDFNEKWYSARVVETDWTEREVLIHFDKWSSRFDEWIPMDSSRLRELQSNAKEKNSKDFSVGEKILATWVDGKKYPAKVNASLGNNKYNILFDDGYSKILKTSKMTKLVQVPTNKCEEKTPHVDNKHEKKDNKKRKNKATEQLSTNSKKKIKSDNVKVQKQELPDVHLRIEIEDSTYKCPKEGCNKNFRKENLLQMHIKHYHPEYSKYLGSTPNVADLAYARTIGGSVEDLMPKKSRIQVQTYQIDYQVASPSNLNSDSCSAEIDNKLENKFSDESVNIALEDSFQENNARPMSPDRLFDIRFKEDKAHTGIKTLLPVRSFIQKTDAAEQNQGTSNYSDSNKKQNSNDLLHKKQKISSREDNYDEVENSLVNNDSIEYENCNDTLDNKLELDSSENNQSKNNISTNDELVKVEKLRKEEIINCTCGYPEEDGLMIQCDLCLCWQHSYCSYIETEEDVPEKYVCYICQNSFRQRDSKKYFLDQNWLHEGQLPSLSSYNTSTKSNENVAILKRSYDLIAGLLKINDLLHSLRVKVNIAQSKDHPKLYLWAKKWNKIAMPNAKIEPVPVMEIIKYENCEGEYSETLAKERTDELHFSPRSNNTQKLIASDTELMKILEEDNLQIGESELETKYSESNFFKDEGRILLDALTKNESDEQENRNEVYNQESLKHTCMTPSQGSDKIDKSQIFLSESGNKSLNLLQPIIPEPEEAIDPVDCKLRLLEHIDHLQTYVDNTLNFIEVQISALEDLRNMKTQNSNSQIQNKQTMLMLINDLNLIRKFVDVFGFA